MFSKKDTKNCKIFTSDLTLTKGQIISKGLFNILEFSQKTIEWIVKLIVKPNSFVHFLGKFQDTKSPFEIIWPLSKCQIDGEDFVIFGGLFRKYEL